MENGPSPARVIACQSKSMNCLGPDNLESSCEDVSPETQAACEAAYEVALPLSGARLSILQTDPQVGQVTHNPKRQKKSESKRCFKTSLNHHDFVVL